MNKEQMKIKVPTGWRQLTYGEVIVKGDRFCEWNDNSCSNDDIGKWSICHSSVGDMYDEDSGDLTGREFCVIRRTWRTRDAAILEIKRHYTEMGYTSVKITIELEKTFTQTQKETEIF